MLSECRCVAVQPHALRTLKPFHSGVGHRCALADALLEVLGGDLNLVSGCRHTLLDIRAEQLVDPRGRRAHELRSFGESLR